MAWIWTLPKADFEEQRLLIAHKSGAPTKKNYAEQTLSVGDNICVCGI